MLWISFYIVACKAEASPKVVDTLQAFNKLGSFFGDERAEKTRKKWGKPLRPVLITDTGILS